ncbi:MAG: hypothetical protein A3H44_09230 [Gammaproteobacteria bacterium RIFCSPLOWO2_02_FULL_57_10]|nr:MAG: hypothetical protein A3H44_09230 [Gammaproteobacteria bacterium RIFCSPLOWO2_02_FULL_57_10]
MDTRMTIKGIAFIFVILFILDAWTTSFLATNFEGQELNPFIDTTDFSSILLSPVNFVVFLIVLLCLFYSEKNKNHLKKLLKLQSIRLIAFFFPTYFMFVKVFAITNNIFPIFGYSTPIHYLRIPFRSITDDTFMQLILVNTVSAVILTPVIIAIAKVLYGEKMKNEGNTDNSSCDTHHDQHRSVDQPTNKVD